MRKSLLVVPALAASLLLGGCAANPYPTDTAEALQSSVLEVSEASAAGDFGGALTKLDVLAVRASDARDRGDLPDERYDDIASAIEAVRGQLEAQTAAAEEAERIAAEQRAAEEAQRIADEQRAAEEAGRIAEEQSDDDDDDNGNGNGNGNGNRGDNGNNGRGGKKDD